MATSVDDPASASVSTPSQTAFLNLSAYMYEGYDTSYASTHLQSDIHFAPLMSNGKAVLQVDNADGLYAEAFESTGPGPKQVVVAYEGTKAFVQGNQFTDGQLIDDAQLLGGKFADSFHNSARFANRVISIAANQGIAKDEVFVTGHSLGAADAEYAASVTGLGGDTFAGPGINTAFTGSLAPAVTDYVDAGDPIGNYAADGNDVLAPELVSDTIKHYGNVVVLPNFTGELALKAASALYKKGGSSEKEAAFVGGIVKNFQDHELTRYAKDLHATLYVDDGSNDSVNGFFGNASAAGTASLTSSQAADLQSPHVAANHHRGDETFVFSQGDGLDVVKGFKPGGPDHDTVDLPWSDFRTFAEVLRNTGDVGGSASITDPKTGDTIRLAGVTTAELKAHPKDFAFV